MHVEHANRNPDHPWPQTQSRHRLAANSISNTKRKTQKTLQALLFTAPPVARTISGAKHDDR